jgi:hypothetical protein
MAESAQHFAHKCQRGVGRPPVSDLTGFATALLHRNSTVAMNRPTLHSWVTSSNATASREPFPVLACVRCLLLLVRMLIQE